MSAPVLGLGDKELNLWAANHIVQVMLTIENQRDLWAEKAKIFGITDSMLAVFDRELQKGEQVVRILREAAK